MKDLIKWFINTDGLNKVCAVIALVIILSVIFSGIADIIKALKR